MHHCESSLDCGFVFPALHTQQQRHRAHPPHRMFIYQTVSSAFLCHSSILASALSRLPLLCVRNITLSAFTAVSDLHQSIQYLFELTAIFQVCTHLETNAVFAKGSNQGLNHSEDQKCYTLSVYSIQNNSRKNIKAKFDSALSTWEITEHNDGASRGSCGSRRHIQP